MRLLDVVFIHSSRKSRGGIVNAALASACAMAKLGHRVELWTASEAVAKKAAALGVNAFQTSALSSPAMSLTSPRIFAALCRARARSADAVIHHGGKLWLIGQLAASSDRHFVIFHNDKIGGRRRFKNWLALSTSHAAELADAARRDGLSRTITPILNGFLKAPSDQGGAPARSYARPLRVGVLAELKHHKGIDLVLSAAARLKMEGIEVELHIGGIGPERDRLMADAIRLGLDNAITWHGWVDDLESFFGSIDVFCVPSRREPFGLVVIEAMVHGKIVIASMTKGPSEILSDRKTGHLVDVDDDQAIATRLKEVMDDPAKASIVAEAGRAHVLKAFSPEAVGSSLEAAITKALAFWRHGS